ncbi:MAG: hypothetical protein H7061_03115 [Bdellovibrionaceae bacterium]|nr:hypothetical protein [Bdellovibrio sp.]
MLEILLSPNEDYDSVLRINADPFEIENFVRTLQLIRPELKVDSTKQKDFFDMYSKMIYILFAIIAAATIIPLWLASILK